MDNVILGTKLISYKVDFKNKSTKKVIMFNEGDKTTC